MAFSVLTLPSAGGVGRARRAIGEVLDLAPRMVRLVGGEELAAELVPVGSRSAVRPGEPIALDGEVESGVSEANQAPITGESVAALKEAGSAVYAGTVNRAGALVVRSTKPSGDRALAQIVRMVGEA